MSLFTLLIYLLFKENGPLAKSFNWDVSNDVFAVFLFSSLITIVCVRMILKLRGVSHNWILAIVDVVIQTIMLMSFVVDGKISSGAVASIITIQTLLWVIVRYVNEQLLYRKK